MAVDERVALPRGGPPVLLPVRASLALSVQPSRLRTKVFQGRSRSRPWRGGRAQPFASCKIVFCAIINYKQGRRSSSRITSLRSCISELGKSMKTVWSLVLMAFCMCAAADADPSQALEAARAKWAKASLRSYSFSIKATCFCLTPKYKGPARIVVTRGKVRSGTYIKSPESFMSGEVPMDARLRYSVEDLFDLIAEGIESKYQSVTASYDEATGHPVTIYLDPGSITDDDVLYEISNFRR